MVYVPPLIRTPGVYPRPDGPPWSTGTRLRKLRGAKPACVSSCEATCASVSSTSAISSSRVDTSATGEVSPLTRRSGLGTSRNKKAFRRRHFPPKDARLSCESGDCTFWLLFWDSAIVNTRAGALGFCRESRNKRCAGLLWGIKKCAGLLWGIKKSALGFCGEHKVRWASVGNKKNSGLTLCGIKSTCSS